MTVDYTAIPKKKKLNRSVMDTAVQKYIEDQSYTITMHGNAEKTYDVTFRSFVPAVMLKAYMEDVHQNVLVQKDGMTVFDFGMLALITHVFMIQNLSTMPLPMMTDDDGNEILDVAAVSAYGEYFLLNSEEYARYYKGLTKIVEKYAKNVMDQYGSFITGMLENINMTDLLGDPAIMNLIQTEVKEQMK